MENGKNQIHDGDRLSVGDVDCAGDPIAGCCLCDLVDQIVHINQVAYDRSASAIEERQLSSASCFEDPRQENGIARPKNRPRAKDRPDSRVLFDDFLRRALGLGIGVHKSARQRSRLGNSELILGSIVNTGGR